MKQQLKNIFINSFLAFVSAFFITTIVHECGHFFSYYIFDAHPTLFHNYVKADNDITQLQKIISLAAGPIIGLLQGIICVYIVSTKKNDHFLILYLWMSLLGFMNFLGYLMMTPFSKVGDTGKIADILELNLVYKFIIFGIGYFFIMKVIQKVCPHFSRFFLHSDDISEKRRFVYSVMFYPIIFGSIVNTVFAFPVPTILSIIYPAISSFVFISSFGVIIAVNRPDQNRIDISNSVIRSFVVLTIALILINRYLATGVSLN